MKICMITPQFVPSMGKPPIYFAKYMRDRGHEVTVITSNLDLANRKIKNVSEMEGINTIRVNSFLTLGKIIMPSLLIRMLRVKADIIYLDGLGEPFITYASWIARRKRIPVILRADWSGNPITSKGLRGIYNKLVNIRILNNSGAITVFSEEQKEKLILSGINENKIYVIPNGVDYEKFANSKGNYLREKLNLRKDDIIILSVARLTPWKNIELTLKSFSKIAKRFDNVHFVNVGYNQDNEYFQLLSRLIKELGIEEKAHLLFDVNHKFMGDVYSSADIFILTSKPFEGMNLSTVEAMSSSLPIITTKVSVTSDIVKNSGCGFLVENENDIIDALSNLIENESLRTRIGEKSKKAAKDYSWNNLLGKVEKIILSLKKN